MRFFRCISELCGGLSRYLRICAALVLGPAALLAQQAPAHHSHPVATAAVLSDGKPIISIRYNCTAEPSGEAGTCTKAVSKQDFDALVRALDPNMSADGRQALAAEYARLLIMAAEARRRGLDQLPEIRTLLDFSALQLLGTRLVRDINGSVLPVSSDEVERYFRDHERDYQEVVLSRIFVPAHVNGESKDVTQAAARAKQVRTRAISGEDFTALQREITEVSPNIRLGPMPCRSILEAHRPVCDLKPNEISNTFADSSGYSIYRLEARSPRELDDVRDEIRVTLERQRVQEEIQKVRTPVSLELDEQYFGKLPKPGLASHHGMHFPNASTTVPAQTHAHQH
jgi:hypothetical protein